MTSWLYSEEELDTLDAEADFDFRMCVEEALLEAVGGLTSSPLRFLVLHEFISLITHGFQEDDAAQCLRFLLAEEATDSWDGLLMQIVLPRRQVSFGTDTRPLVVAAAVAYWKDACR